MYTESYQRIFWGFVLAGQFFLVVPLANGYAAEDWRAFLTLVSTLTAAAGLWHMLKGVIGLLSGSGSHRGGRLSDKIRRQLRERRVRRDAAAAGIPYDPDAPPTAADLPPPWGEQFRVVGAVRLDTDAMSDDPTVGYVVVRTHGLLEPPEAEFRDAVRKLGLSPTELLLRSAFDAADAELMHRGTGGLPVFDAVASTGGDPAEDGPAVRARRQERAAIARRLCRRFRPEEVAALLELEVDEVLMLAAREDNASD